MAADSLRDYEMHGYVRNENNLQKIAWLLTALLLALAYVPPAVGFVLPLWASAALFLVWIPLGLLSLRRVVSFRYYREMNQELLAQIPGQMDKARAAVKTANEKNISADTSITSRKKGFEFLNDLFVKRHRKILWKSALRIAYVCLFLCCGAGAAHGDPARRQGGHQCDGHDVAAVLCPSSCISSTGAPALPRPCS